MFLKALVSRPTITWRSRVGSPSAARSGSTSTLELDVPGRLDRGDRRRGSPTGTSTTSVSPAPTRLDPGQGQQRPGQAVHPLGVLGEPVEEVVARLGVVLGALLQDLDRARDPGQRVAQLVGGVGDEVGFGELAAHLVGAVADDDEHGALVGQGPGRHRVGAVADPHRRVGGEAELGGATQVGQHRLGRAVRRGRAGRAAALLEKRTGPSSSTTITASVRPSKIACSLLRSAVSTPKLSFSEARIESSARARSPISSRPPTSSGASKEPAAISPAARARRSTRWEIADRDQEAGEDAERDRAEHRARAVAEQVDDAGGEQADRGEGSRPARAACRSASSVPTAHRRVPASFHEGLLTQCQPPAGMPWENRASEDARLHTRPGTRRPRSPR